MATFGERLRHLRMDSGLTQTALGELIGYKRRMVQSLESGEREPNLETINKLTELFQCSSDYLLGIDDHDDVLENIVSEALKKYGLDSNDPKVREKVDKMLALLFGSE